MSLPKLTAVLYTPNAYKASVGVLVSQNDGEEFKSIVEVRKKNGTGVYEWIFEDNQGNGITRVEAKDLWEICADNYGAVLLSVDSKFMNEHFKGILKPYLKMRADQRREDKESKALNNP